ncbi:TetR family transcriptional regulator [Rhodococcus wratislaviensis]|uniref:Transcriptional regulator n=1 Tax=Rhodococcus wratislaviensis TaxID=44752 RepID=A0AB38FPF3_RHOWR|nr:TetR/AcrR family transcriptional regulator [Rhodococcus wratislaviensis]REE75782.1 TetR family transcriptional regulator [Rhodococcus wratislaviensis]SPZ43485.1 transcriptional regulator [Rhodococcus wratislaviensis]
MPTSPARSSEPATDTPRRVTKRRGQTRRRLLDAAVEVFADNGFGRSTVEQICERGGYTRGAFYSNFASLDEMFFAMWEQRSSAMLAQIRLAADSSSIDLSGLTPAEKLRAGTELVLGVVPVDDQWYRINAEFTAHALRNPSLKKALAAREDTILDTIVPILEKALHRLGRRAVGDPRVLGRALVALHDGTSVQCLIEDDDASARELRLELFTHVVAAYTEPDTTHTHTHRKEGSS